MKMQDLKMLNTKIDGMKQLLTFSEVSTISVFDSLFAFGCIYTKPEVKLRRLL